MCPVEYHMGLVAYLPSFALNASVVAQFAKTI